MRVSTVAVVLGGWLASASLAHGADRTAQQVLKEIDAIKLPSVDSDKKEKKGPASAAEIKAREAAQRRSKLILELYKVAPDHKRIPALMEERWQLIGTPEKTRYAEFVGELDKVFKANQGRTPEDRGSLLAGHAQAQSRQLEEDSRPFRRRRLPEARPQGSRAEMLLGTAASVTKDEKKRTALLERLNKDYPGSDLAGMLGHHDQSFRHRQAVQPRVHQRDRRQVDLDEGSERARSSSSTSGPPGAAPASARCRR